MAEHFVQAPNWGWIIASYFFLAGLAGGSYVLATMLGLWGSPRDAQTARFAFLLAFPLAVVCAILLTIDLGEPLRFWHMMINTTPGNGGFNFKYWSPLSLGTWTLLVFSVFALISFIEAILGRDRPTMGRQAFNVIGSLVALLLCSYTGVVLSVSNQPVWSDSWAIGGLFLASALSGSAALLAWRAHVREGASTELHLHAADRYFAALELLLIVIFFITLSAAGTLSKTLSGVWLVLWILVLISLVPPLAGIGRGRFAVSSAVAGAAVIIGVLLMRIAVIFSAQY